MIRLFIYIAILNFLDGVFTYYGLSQDYITEANPIMDYLWHVSPLLFLFTKVLFSAIALYLAFLFRKKNINATILTKSLWLVALLLYAFVFGLHMIWMKLYLFN